jgi:hypothetical protein
VDSDRLKQEWLGLIGTVVKTDNSSSRRTRSSTTYVANSAKKNTQKAKSKHTGLKGFLKQAI